jgi:hypothetical protein
VRDRNVVELAIGRDNDAVWTIDIDRHVAGVDLMIEPGVGSVKADQRDLVSRL